jgi:hypothetical protein
MGRRPGQVVIVTFDRSMQSHRPSVKDFADFRKDFTDFRKGLTNSRFEKFHDVGATQMAFEKIQAARPENMLTLGKIAGDFFKNYVDLP